MKAYIATKYENGARAAELASLLEARGYEITRKWWNFPPYQLNDPDSPAAQEAEEDINAVRAADFLIFIDEEDLNYRGAWAEVGAALVLGKTVYVLGEHHKSAVFGHHPLVKKMRWPV